MGHEFEQFYRSISGAPKEVACPTCGKKAERQISAGGGLVFKGSGFYITDYGKDGKKSQTAPPASGETSTTAGESGAKGDSKSAGESKPAAESKSTGESKSSGESKSGSESKSSGESKPRDPKPAAASKSAAKGSSGRAKRSE